MTCDHLAARDHSTVTCTSGNRFGSICSYKPELGYELRGPTAITCSDVIGDMPPIPIRECFNL